MDLHRKSKKNPLLSINSNQNTKTDKDSIGRGVAQRDTKSPKLFIDTTIRKLFQII